MFLSIWILIQTFLRLYLHLSSRHIQIDLHIIKQVDFIELINDNEVNVFYLIWKEYDFSIWWMFSLLFWLSCIHFLIQIYRTTIVLTFVYSKSLPENLKNFSKFSAKVFASVFRYMFLRNVLYAFSIGSLCVLYE